MVDFAEPSPADYHPAPEAAAPPAEVALASSYEDDEEDDEAGDDRGPKPWDEGGPSDCGYSAAVHDALMTVGARVHAVVGAPPPKVRAVQEAVGNWFQELSYAARDILRGENTAEMHKDAADAMSTIFYGEDAAAEVDEQKLEGDDHRDVGVVGAGPAVVF